MSSITDGAKTAKPTARLAAQRDLLSDEISRVTNLCDEIVIISGNLESALYGLPPAQDGPKSDVPSPSGSMNMDELLNCMNGEINRLNDLVSKYRELVQA